MQLIDSEERKYLLAIKRGNRDYLPLEWNLTEFYDGEDLTTLRGIDAFTGKMNEDELLRAVLKKNLTDISEKFERFDIIYFEKNKVRVVKEGVLFKIDADMVDLDYLINLFTSVAANKDMMNALLMLCNQQNPSLKLQEFAFVVKNIDYFALKGDNALRVAFSKIKEVPYDEMRKICIPACEKIEIYLDQLKDLKLKKGAA